MTAPRILVVDDEPDIRVLIQEILEDENYQVTVAENGALARQAWLEDPPDLLLLDIWMPDIDGISLLREWTQSNTYSAPVIMISGHGTVETAVQATRLGAFDYIEKPLSTAKLLLTVEKALASSHDNASAGSGEFAVTRSAPIGKSPLIVNLREQASRLASSATPILLIGEIGCGKSLFARYIHVHSPSCEGPLLKVNVAALAPDSQEAALFGKETVQETQPGVFRQAKAGTVFLDRIEALTPGTQHRLYRFLETERAVGTGEHSPISPRLLAATSVDLVPLVQSGRFREDLYYWLSTLSLSIPPLRDRCEDIPELLNYFVDLLVEQEGLPYRHFSVAAQNRLRNYAWPGNIQELRNLVRRLLIVGKNTEIELAEAEASLEPISVAKTPLPIDLGLPLREAREQFERLYLEHKLRETGGNVGKAAKLVEMERTHLYRKLRALGIDTKQLGSQE